MAITANAVALKTASRFGIVAESGGLLKLHVIYLRPLVQSAGISEWWAAQGLPGPPSMPFWLVFHYVTGLAMVALYVFLLEPVLPGGVLMKGSLFSLLPWLINGLIVLPLLDQGLFGLSVLPLSGVLYFFVANWLFGAVLGILYAKFRGGAQ